MYHSSAVLDTIKPIWQYLQLGDQNYKFPLIRRTDTRSSRHSIVLFGTAHAAALYPIQTSMILCSKYCMNCSP